MTDRADNERLHVGQVLEVTVEKAVYRGLGLARHQGEVVFVRRGLPGDHARVVVESARSAYAYARVEALLEPGASRRSPPCGLSAACGGCAYQGLDYAAQLGLKEAVLRETLGRAGIPWEKELPLRPSPEEAWRTRASFHLGEESGRLVLGLHEEGTRRVVDLPRCLQLSPGMNQAARALLAFLEAHRSVARGIRSVQMAESLTEDQLALAIEIPGEERGGRRISPALLDGPPSVTGWGALVGQGRGRQWVPLRGEPHVHATVLGLRLRSHILSFFQANRFLVEDLARAVAELTPVGGTVLDLYAGVGLFALTLASRAERVLAVESSPWAFRDARKNATRAGLTHVTVQRGKVGESLAAWPCARDERIILDPPRAGAGPEIVRAVTARRPEAVIYVSCDPPTLVRDLKCFEALGYRADHMEALDLFPDTFHLETVVRLRPE